MEQYNFDSKSKVAEASDKSFMASTLRFILPMQLSDAISLSTQKNRKAYQEVEHLTVTYKWKGDNVAEVTVSSADWQEIYTSSYTYDKKNNPYCDLLFGIDEEGGNPSMLSKNNILSGRHTYSNSYSYSATYSYTYDGNFPKEQKVVYSDGTYSNTSVTYYEYK
jgi:hypothetical protein